MATLNTLTMPLRCHDSMTFTLSLWLQLMVFECLDLVRDDVLLPRHCDCDGDDEGGGDDERTRSRSLFIAAVSRCCSLLHRPLSPQQQLPSSSLSSSSSSSSAAAAASASRPVVHDSAASAAYRAFHRMVAMFPLHRCRCCLPPQSNVG